MPTASAGFAAGAPGAAASKAGLNKGMLWYCIFISRYLGFSTSLFALANAVIADTNTNRAKRCIAKSEFGVAS